MTIESREPRVERPEALDPRRASPCFHGQDALFALNKQKSMQANGLQLLWTTRGSYAQNSESLLDSVYRFCMQRLGNACLRRLEPGMDTELSP